METETGPTGFVWPIVFVEDEWQDGEMGFLPLNVYTPEYLDRARVDVATFYEKMCECCATVVTETKVYVFENTGCGLLVIENLCPDCAKYKEWAFDDGATYDDLED